MESSETVTNISQVWMKVLGIGDIAVNDNFFEIGGKSILIPLIIIQLKKEFDMNVSIVDMLQFPTIASLAGHIDNLVPAATKRVQIKAMQQKRGLKEQQRRAMKARKRKI